MSRAWPVPVVVWNVVLVAVSGVVLVLAGCSASPEPVLLGRAAQDGLMVEASLLGPPSAWEQREVTFVVHEDGFGERPVDGLRPLAWFIRRDAGEAAPDTQQCARKIRGILGGRLALGEAVSLNESLIVTLDDHASLSIVDPQIDSSRTRTRGMVPLPGRGADLVLLSDERTVIVTLPLVGAVAYADIEGKRAQTVAVGGRPLDVAVAADEAWAVVGDAEGTHVTILDVQHREVSSRVEAGPGPHAFALRSNSRDVLIWSPRAPTLVHLEPGTGQHHSIDLGGLIAGVARPAGTTRAWVATADGRIFLVDETHHRVLEQQRRPARIAAVALDPSGRFLFVLEPEGPVVSIVDTATGRWFEPVEAPATPVRVEFSDRFAYVMLRGRADVLLVDLPSLAASSSPVVAKMVLGQRPLVADEPAAPAPLLAMLPRGDGVLAAHFGDSALHQIMEGMTAPVGSSPSYPWAPRGLLVVDRALREVAPGAHRTRVRLPRPGTWDLAFLVPSSPRIVSCFSVEVTELVVNPVERSPLVARVEAEPRTAAPGAPVRLRVHVAERGSGAPVDGITDLTIVAVAGPRQSARGAAVAVGGGWYQAELRLPSAGRWEARVGSASMGIPFSRAQPTAIDVAGEPADEQGAQAHDAARATAGRSSDAPGASPSTGPAPARPPVQERTEEER